MDIVRTTGVKVECGNVIWYNEFQYESEAILAYHVVDDVLSAMMYDGVIGEFKASLSSEKHLQADNEEE